MDFTEMEWGVVNEINFVQDKETEAGSCGLGVIPQGCLKCGQYLDQLRTC
jgi:hypothetical protein